MVDAKKQLREPDIDRDINVAQLIPQEIIERHTNLHVLWNKIFSGEADHYLLWTLEDLINEHIKIVLAMDEEGIHHIQNLDNLDLKTVEFFESKKPIPDQNIPEGDMPEIEITKEEDNPIQESVKIYDPTGRLVEIKWDNQKMSIKQDTEQLKVFQDFIPPKVSLSTPKGKRQLVDNLFNMIKRFPVFVEKKYDGVRHLIHKDGDKIKIISEDGKDNTKRLPQIIESVKKLSVEKAIFDAELEIWINGKHQPQEFMDSYLNRKSKANDTNVVANIFDMPFLEKDITNKPLRERRKLLNNIKISQKTNNAPDIKKKLNLVPIVEAKNKDDLKIKTEELRFKVGSEGIVVKKTNSIYNINGTIPDNGWLEFNNNASAIVTIGKVTQVKEGFVYDIGVKLRGNITEKDKIRINNLVFLRVGKTFPTIIKADVGDRLRLEFDKASTTFDMDKDSVTLELLAPVAIEKTEAIVSNFGEVINSANKSGVLVKNIIENKKETVATLSDGQKTFINKIMKAFDKIRSQFEKVKLAKVEIDLNDLKKIDFDDKILADAIEEGMRAEYTAGLAIATNVIGKPIIKTINKEASKNIRETALTLSATIKADIQDTIRKELAEGMLKGEGIPKLRNRILGVFDEGTITKVKAVRDRTGKIIRKSYERRITPRQRAEVIARSESANALGKASTDYWDSVSDKVIEAWEWSTSGSDRVCVICSVLDGTIHPTSEAFEIPHGNCECAPLPVVMPASSLRANVKPKFVIDKNVLSMTDHNDVFSPKEKLFSDKGWYEKGIWNNSFREFWLHGKKYSGKYIARLIDSKWKFVKAKNQMPHILSGSLTPNNGHPAMPKAWQVKVPKTLRWWEQKLSEKEISDMVIKARNLFNKKKEINKIVKKVEKLGEVQKKHFTKGTFKLSMCFAEDNNKIYNLTFNGENSQALCIHLEKNPLFSYPINIIEIKNSLSKNTLLDSGNAEMVDDTPHSTIFRLEGVNLNGFWRLGRNENIFEKATPPKARLMEEIDLMIQKLNAQRIESRIQDYLDTNAVHKLSFGFAISSKNSLSEAWNENNPVPVPLRIFGTALEEGTWIGMEGRTVTYTKKSIMGSPPLAGTQLRIMHNDRDQSAVVGWVIDDKNIFDKKTGKAKKIYEAIIFDQEAAKAVLQKKFPDVSVTVWSKERPDPDNRDNTITDKIRRFDELSLVTKGACRTADVNISKKPVKI